MSIRSASGTFGGMAARRAADDRVARSFPSTIGVPDWGGSVRDLTGGGVDHVVEVGGPGTLAPIHRSGTRRGHISLIGVLGK